MQPAQTIRIAGRQDARACAALHARCFDPAWDAEVMEVFFADPNCIALYAGEAACEAFLIVRIAADEAEILTIAVAPERRRQGLARRLLTGAAAELRSRGVQRLFLEVDDTNLAALALYRDLGAERIGHRPAYYANGADASIYSLAL